MDYISFYKEHIEGLKQVSKDEWQGQCPFGENHSDGIDSNPSLSINSLTGQYYCHACGENGNQNTFCKKMKIPIPRREKGKYQKPVTIFDYRDEKGKLLYQICRFLDIFENGRRKKKFGQRRPDGKGGWKWQVKDIPKIPYRLPDLLKADSEEWVFIPEGEKHCDKLHELGFTASCNVAGAGKWTPDLNQYFKNRKVCILPDNDPPGQRHAEKVAQNLKGIAKEIRVLNLPGLETKGDIINWFDGFHTKEELLSLLDNERSWEPGPIEATQPATLENKPIEADPNEAIINKLNKKHSVIMMSGKCVVLNEITDYTFNRPDVTFSSPTDFKAFYSNRFVFIKKQNQNGNTEKVSIPIGKYWFNHPKRRQYEGITFAPKKETPNYYNLYQGFAVEPKKGNCELYLEHIYENVASGNDQINKYIIGWMADAVQNPSERPGTSIVFRGKMGVGKGISCSQFGKLFGPHFLHIQNSKHLIGNFNSHLKNALIVFADEAFWAGDKQAEGILKGLVTEEIFTIEPKGKDAFQIKNHVRLLVSSNNAWVIPAGLEERRFFVIDVGEKHMQDRPYFKKIVRQMDNGGREALLYYLLNYDLSDIDLGVFPMTIALFENKLHSMTNFQKFWFRKLEAGAQLNNEDYWIDGLIPAERFQNEFFEFMGSKKTYEDKTSIGIELRKLVPWVRRKQPMGTNRKRYYAYQFPPLEECREFWEKRLRMKIEWPEEGYSLSTPNEGLIQDVDF